MKKSNQTYIIDIITAIDLVLEDYTHDISFEQFENDKKTQDAVVRQIAIIGEAMNKLSKDYIEEHPDLPVKEAVAMRNILVHDYDWVDTKEVWKTLEKDLPHLKRLLQDQVGK